MTHGELPIILHAVEIMDLVFDFQQKNNHCEYSVERERSLVITVNWSNKRYLPTSKP